jgi:hypothetical protein
MSMIGTCHKDKRTRGKLKKVLRLGGAYAITLPREFAADTDYVLVIEAENGLLIKKIKVLENGGPLHPPTPPRGRGEPP